MGFEQNLRLLFLGFHASDEQYFRACLASIPELPKHFEIHVGHSILESEELMRDESYSCIFLATSLLKNSLEFRKIHEAAKESPIILFSFQDEMDICTALQNEGADDYLIKEHVSPELISRTMLHAIERKKLIRQISRAKAKNFQNLIDRNLDGLLIVNPEMKILFCNHSASLILNKSVDDLIGQYFDYKKNSDQHGEKVLIDAKGQKHFFEVRVSKLNWEGEAACLILLRDISEDKLILKLQSELLEHERLSQLKDEFISTVSHELRTPLAIVNGAISNLLDGIVGPMSDQQVHVMDLANRNVKRLTKIIEDILDLSRLESRKIRPHRRAVSLKKILKETVQNFTQAAKEKSILLQLNLPLALPDIFVDSEQITRVFDNLLSNALRFSRTSIDIEVEHIAQKKQNSDHAFETGYLRVHVKDDGDGIEGVSQESIFSKFVQINRPAGGAGYKGTGLGLSICKEIVDLHGGHIGLKSAVGQGTEFWVDLPLYDEELSLHALIEESLIEVAEEGGNLSVILMDCENFSEIRESLSAEQCIDLFDRIERVLRAKILRRQDQVVSFLSKGQILILAKSNREGSHAIVHRIPDIIRHLDLHSFPVMKAPRFSIGISVYPEDAREVEKLYSVAIKNKTKKKVLLVDDEQAVLEMLSMLLKERDFQVDVALDGEDALARIEAFKPDIIVSDIRMPGMSGWELCEVLKRNQETKEIPLVFLTASQEKNLEDKVKACGAQCLLRKPYSNESIVTVLRSELNRHMH